MINLSVPFDMSFEIKKNFSFFKQAITLTLVRGVRFSASVQTQPIIQPRDLHFYVQMEPFLIKVKWSVTINRFRLNKCLFSEYFVCDWYMNVNCENSENFYGLNNLIGKPMETFSKKELMNSARDIIMFPKQTTNFDPSTNGDMYNNYPSEFGSSLGITSSGDSRVPSRGSLNLGQPTAGSGNFPSSPYSPNPLAPSGVLPTRGANGGTVYVNSLGQLSTDEDAGFDPKRSFILRTDKDSNFDQDLRIPSNSFDTLKGIGNSYSFGIPGGNNAPSRGSADLSEPVDPSEYLNNQNDPYLTPFNRKQLYTYPHDAQSQGLNNLQGILPEYTGQINTKLAAQSPKYQAPQVYGPAAIQTQSQQSISSSRPQQPQQPQRLYQQPHQTVKQQQQQNAYKPAQPIRLYQQPQQPQPFRAQNQQPIERRQFNAAPQNNGYQTRGNLKKGNGNYQQQPQSGNKQNNNDYLRNFLKDKTYIHHDKVQLVELIQRLFVPPHQKTRVVSADVQPSLGESFSFSYDDDQGSPSNTQSNYQSGHQHSGTCGHHGY